MNFRGPQICPNQKCLHYFTGKEGPDPKHEVSGNSNFSRLWKKQHKAQLQVFIALKNADREILTIRDTSLD